MTVAQLIAWLELIDRPEAEVLVVVNEDPAELVDVECHQSGDERFVFLTGVNDDAETTAWRTAEAEEFSQERAESAEQAEEVAARHFTDPPGA